MVIYGPWAEQQDWELTMAGLRAFVLAIPLTVFAVAMAGLFDILP